MSNEIEKSFVAEVREAITNFVQECYPGGSDALDLELILTVVEYEINHREQTKERLEKLRLEELNKEEA